MKHNNFFKILTFFFSLLSIGLITSQEINDNFEDGNITGWTEGTAGHWISSTASPINGVNSLKHNLSSTSGSSYISHSISGLDISTKDATWQFNLKNGSWDPSGSNKFWVYLTANESDLSSSTVDGYAVGVNLSGTSDDVTLWKVTNGAGTALITSDIDWNASTLAGIRVTRTSSGDWELLIDNNGGFDNLVSKGTASNSDYTFNDFFGLNFVYTSSRAGFLWMDDVLVESSVTGPTVGFNNASSSVTETNADQTVMIPVTMSNYGGTQVDLSVSVNTGAGTAEAGDYTLNTTSLSFTADGTQNVSLTIKDDADTDDETIVLEITETSSTGITISNNQHTVTVIDDEIPPMPTAGTVFITEVSDASSTSNEFIEIYNNTNNSVSTSTSKLVMASASGTSQQVYDFGTDITAVNIPARGFLIISRGASKTAFETAFGPLNANVVFIQGNSGMYFGTSTARRWMLYIDGTSNTKDGTLIDDTDSGVGGSNRHYQDIFTDTYISDSDANASPGELEYLVNSGGNWVNSVAMDETTGTKNVYIFDDLTLSTNGAANDLGVTSGKTLTINSGNSLIVNGNSTGTVTYKRNLPTTNWYLISAPVTGETIEDIRTANSLATNGSSEFSFASYDNTQAVATDRWDYITATSTGALPKGKGYSMKVTTSEDVNFTGTLNTTDVTYSITESANAFNLVGNPFTAPIAVNPNAHATNNFLTVNSGELSETTLWFWNQATGTYEAVNLGTSPKFAAVAQGFFVSAKTGGGTISFNKNMQQHQADNFQKQTNTRSEIKVSVTQKGITKSTDILYINQTSTGFDNGYDSSVFGGVDASFQIFSQLVSNNQGKNLAIQSLPNADYENMIVPIGLIAEKGEEIVFSANSINLPSGVEVYLEDRTNGVFTKLSEKNYSITLNNNANGIGQFYLHTASKALNVDTVKQELKNVSIYQSNTDELTITGLQTEKAMVHIYSIVGKQVFTNTITSNGVSTLTLPNLNTGVYIVNITSNLGKVSKKVVLK